MGEQEETEGYPVVGRIGVGDGRTGVVGGRTGAGGDGTRGCATPTALGRGERVGELQWVVGKVSGVSIWDEVGWRRGLRGGRRPAAALCRGGGSTVSVSRPGGLDPN